jgi:hypothetical protein
MACIFGRGVPGRAASQWPAALKKGVKRTNDGPLNAREWERAGGLIEPEIGRE